MASPSRALAGYLHKFLRLFVPLAMIGVLVTNLLLVMKTGLGAWTWPVGLLLIQILFYLAAGIGNTVTLPGKLGKLVYLPTFLVNSNWAALLGLVRFLRGQQTTQWQRVQRRDIPIN